MAQTRALESELTHQVVSRRLVASESGKGVEHEDSTCQIDADDDVRLWDSFLEETRQLAFAGQYAKTRERRSGWVEDGSTSVRSDQTWECKDAMSITNEYVTQRHLAACNSQVAGGGARGMARGSRRGLSAQQEWTASAILQQWCRVAFAPSDGSSRVKNRVLCSHPAILYDAPLSPTTPSPSSVPPLMQADKQDLGICDLNEQQVDWQVIEGGKTTMSRVDVPNLGECAAGWGDSE
ncbi:hypothetical protein EDB85DRAFT_1892049 [Lactarius pseudohatsudake]|nr:hypothetical protein EDB85DRAFT_1892049 [Lactarius pseudohatsudake]